MRKKWKDFHCPLESKKEDKGTNRAIELYSLGLRTGGTWVRGAGAACFDKMYTRDGIHIPQSWVFRGYKEVRNT